MSIARQFLATGLMGLLAGTAFIGGDALAQQIFRIVGPDGRVTFSDQPPPVGSPSAKAAPSVPMTGGGSDAGSLPFELRQVVNRYPVLLYTGDNCAPCTSGKSLLASRGVPYTEKTVVSTDDIEVFKRIGGTQLPVLVVGGQQLKGFSDIEWAQYLDAAGYPKSSMLPPGFRMAPATPLVAAAAPASPASGAASGRQAAANGDGGLPPPPPANPSENPAGIRF